MYDSIRYDIGNSGKNGIQLHIPVAYGKGIIHIHTCIYCRQMQSFALLRNIAVAVVAYNNTVRFLICNSLKSCGSILVIFPVP